MALNTYGGFAQGFQQGFGLMEGVKGRRLKEDMFENTKEKQALDEQYRQDTLDFQKTQEQNTQDYRTQDLDYKRQSAESSAALSALNAQISQLNAQTAGTKADTANLEAKALLDPNSLVSKEKQAEIDKAEADIASTEEATAVSRANRTEYQNAAILNRLYAISNRSNNGPLGESDLAQYQQDVEALTGGGRFDLGFILNPATEDSMVTIQNFVQNLSDGSDPEMTPEVVGAFDDMLGVGKSAAVGRTLDDTFVNAPDWMKDGKHKVVSQGLHEVGSYDGQQFGGTMYVMVENQETGDVYPYFPPLTSNRSNKSNQPLSLTFDEAMQGTAGTAHMIRSVTPVLKEHAKQARVKTLFGDNKGDSGVDKFNAAVDRRLEEVRQGIQSGADPKSLMFMPNAENATVSERLGYAETDENRRRIEHEILYGPKNKTQDNVRVSEWFQETSQALNNMPMPNGFKTNLGGVVKGQWTPQNVSILQGYYNDDGTISDEKGLIAALQQLKFI
jgi:hypothetical protein